MERIRSIISVLLLTLLSVLSIVRASLYQDAVLLWGNAAAQSPNKARPHNNLGHSLKEKGRLEEAMREFERAIELDPEYADALNNLATIYGSVGRRDEAIVLLNRTLQLCPDHVPAKYNLAMQYYETGHTAEAEQEYASIVRIAPYSKEAAFAQRMIVLIRNNVIIK